MNQPATKPVLLVIGDSISLQYGPHLKKYLAGDCEYHTKHAVGDAFANLDMPQGNNGGDSRMVLEYLQVLKKQGGLHADVMLLNAGLHDIKVNLQTRELAVPIDQYESNLHKIVTLIHEAGIPLFWVSTTASIDDIHNTRTTKMHRFARDNDAYAAVADRVMQSHGVAVIDLRTFTLSLGGEEVFCDHIHFHEPIRALQAAYITGWLKARVFRGTRAT